MAPSTTARTASAATTGGGTQLRPRPPPPPPSPSRAISTPPSPRRTDQGILVDRPLSPPRPLRVSPPWWIKEAVDSRRNRSVRFETHLATRVSLAIRVSSLLVLRLRPQEREREKREEREERESGGVAMGFRWKFWGGGVRVNEWRGGGVGESSRIPDFYNPTR